MAALVIDMCAGQHERDIISASTIIIILYNAINEIHIKSDFYYPRFLRPRKTADNRGLTVYRINKSLPSKANTFAFSFLIFQNSRRDNITKRGNQCVKLLKKFPIPVCCRLQYPNYRYMIFK